METSGSPGRPARVTAEVAAEVRRRFGTPCYVYDHAALEAAARRALAFPAPFGLTVRYAMKANPSRGILTLFRDLGLHVDASSDFEVERALGAGFAPARVQRPCLRLRWIEIMNSPIDVAGTALGQHVARGRAGGGRPPEPGVPGHRPGDRAGVRPDLRGPRPARTIIRSI